MSLLAHFGSCHTRDSWYAGEVPYLKWQKLGATVDCGAEGEYD